MQYARKLDHWSIQSIRLYQSFHYVFASVLMSTFGVVMRCKHNPTCSEYTIEQIERHGTIRGILSGMRRILMCW